MLDLLYPRNCVSCGTSTLDSLRYICWDCISDTIKLKMPFCVLCGDPVAGNVQHDYTCFSCARKRPTFDCARSAVCYEGAIGDALRTLKYDHAVWVGSDLSTLLLTCVQAEYSAAVFNCITAVPLFSARRRERGFNQSSVLGVALAKQLQLPFESGLLRRIRPTATQTGLTAPQRMANVRNAFRIGLFARPEGKRVLLVDDVMTTGATANACAGTLKRAGAVSVHVVTVARG